MKNELKEIREQVAELRQKVETLTGANNPDSWENKGYQLEVLQRLWDDLWNVEHGLHVLWMENYEPN